MTLSHSHTGAAAGQTSVVTGDEIGLSFSRTIDGRLASPSRQNVELLPPQRLNPRLPRSRGRRVSHRAHICITDRTRTGRARSHESRAYDTEKLHGVVQTTERSAYVYFSLSTLDCNGKIPSNGAKHGPHHGLQNRTVGHTTHTVLSLNLAALVNRNNSSTSIRVMYGTIRVIRHNCRFSLYVREKKTRQKLQSKVAKSGALFLHSKSLHHVTVSA